MKKNKYVFGVDFGTESGRVLLADVNTGRECAVSVQPYASGVIDETLPGSGRRLPPDWALQDPADYLEVVKQGAPAVLRDAGVLPEDVIGLGVDFTACTVLPALSDGTPLCFLPRFREEPHAWVKLWKHHAAQPQADRINQLARELKAPWLETFGGRISSEWLLPKVLQTLQEAPEIFAAAEKWIEAGDWLVWRLTGVETRNSCAAGYKGLWQKQGGHPSNEFHCALDPRLDQFVARKLGPGVRAVGSRAGGLSAAAAAWTGLPAGLPVGVATIDAHASVPGAGVSEPGTMVLILGTSTCHMMLDREKHLVPGISGVVEDGILPGLFGYEAGQAGVGDMFAWFVNHAVPPEFHERARSRNQSVHAVLEEEAARQTPGAHGLLALDWWNGNRSVLVNANLSGALVGATLSTQAPDIYRALIEATAYGTRMIIDAFEAHGVRVGELIACGGLAERNKLLMRIYADVTGRPFKEAGSSQTCALGAAMLGAVAAGAAAGGYDTITEAARRMTHVRDTVYRPAAAHSAIYERLFAEYRRLHDYFGRGENPVMETLRGIRQEALGHGVSH